MDTTRTREPPPVPPPPPFATPVDLAPDEVDVDLALGDEDHQLATDDRDTLIEGVEYLGHFDSLEAYFRSVLEEFMDSSVHWALDCLEWDVVQSRFEGSRYRYMVQAGQVFRIVAPLQDQAGPWMPTRGA